MPDALTPALALDYLHELSADIRAGAVLAPDGTALAGTPAMAAAAQALFAAAPDAAELRVATPAGAVFAARDDRHAVVVACGRHALPALVAHDLRAVLDELAGRRRAAA